MVETKTMNESRLYWSLRLEFLRTAEHRFAKLEEEASKRRNFIAELEPSDMVYMLTAAFAVAKLHRYSKQELSEFAESGLVHPSTISGGSLPVAYSTLEDYLLEKRQVFQ